MVDQLTSETTVGSPIEGSASLKTAALKKLDDGLSAEIGSGSVTTKGDVASGFLEATRTIGAVLSASLPALAFRGKPTLSCPHRSIKLVAEDIEGNGKATTSAKGVKPKVTKQKAEKAAKEMAEKNAKDLATRDLQTQQDGISCAGKCKKVRGEPKVKVPKKGKGKTVDEKDNPNGTTTFKAKATAVGSATVRCK